MGKKNRDFFDATPRTWYVIRFALKDRDAWMDGFESRRTGLSRVLEGMDGWVLEGRIV